MPCAVRHAYRYRAGVHALKTPTVAAALLLVAAFALDAAAQTPPPAPALISPASGATLAQPMTLRWSAVSDPDGPIGSYTWQVGTTSTFSVVIASGFTTAGMAIRSRRRIA
jgi:hypothetical protein